MKRHPLTVKLACSLMAVLLLAGCMTAQDYVKKGEESPKFEESVKYFNRALELEPDNIDLRKSIARDYASKGEKSSKFEESVRYYEKALELDPDNIELRKSIAAKYTSEIKKNSGKKRIELFEKAIKLDPDNTDIYFANAYALCLRDVDYLATARAFEDILEKAPEFQLPNNQMGAKGTVFGLKSSDLIHMDKCSPLLVIGISYYDATGATFKLSPMEKNSLLTKSLQSLLKGYELDITQGQNNTQEAKTLYLLQMARTAERIEDYELAIQCYTTFLNDSSIKLDKAGISEKRQPLYAKAGQQPSAVASSTPPSSGSTSNQQNRPAPVDWTGSTETLHVVEVGSVYRLKFSSRLNSPVHTFAMDVPPYIRTVTAFTESNLDTVIEWGGGMMFLFEMMGNIVKPTDIIIVDDQSSTNRNASITFPTIPQGPAGRKIEFSVEEKNGREGDFILVIQGTR
jgi:tetratricopeptide (TPR) repeat protein